MSGFQPAAENIDKKKIILKLSGISGMLIFLAVAVIWSFLFRIGRQDLFLEAVTFQSLFSFAGVAFVISVAAFSFVYFSPSFFAALVIRRYQENYSDYDRIKWSYILLLFIATLLSISILLSVSWFFPSERLSQMEMTVVMLAVCPLCILLSVLFNKRVVERKSRYMQGSDKFFFIIRMHIGTPSAIAVASWVYIFPQSLLLSYLKFPPHTDNITELLVIFALSMIVLLTSLLPGAVFIGMKKESSWINLATRVGGTACLILVLLSPFLPVIPVLISNYTVKITGIINADSYRYFLPVSEYPVEMFSKESWHYSKTSDGNFHSFDGVTLFSFGTLRMVCPVSTMVAYKDSLDYIFASEKYDDEQREKLRNEAKNCLVFSNDELKKMGKS